MKCSIIAEGEAPGSWLTNIKLRQRPQYKKMAGSVICWLYEGVLCNQSLSDSRRIMQACSPSNIMQHCWKLFVSGNYDCLCNLKTGAEAHVVMAFRRLEALVGPFGRRLVGECRDCGQRRVG